MEGNDPHAWRLRELLKKLVRGIGLLHREEAACCGITLSQCHALGEVATQEGLTPGKLAVRLGIDPSAVTRITDALVQNGLVRRENDPSDRRLVRLFSTPKGRSLWEGVQATMLDRTRTIIERLPSDQRLAILQALEHLAKALESLGPEGYLPHSPCREGTKHGQEGP